MKKERGEEEVEAEEAEDGERVVMRNRVIGVGRWRETERTGGNISEIIMEATSPRACCNV